MFRKSILLVLSLFALVLFAACAGAAPQANQEAAEVAPTTAPVDEEPAVEMPAESSEESTAEEGEVATYAVDPQASTVVLIASDCPWWP